MGLKKMAFVPFWHHLVLHVMCAILTSAGIVVVKCIVIAPTVFFRMCFRKPVEERYVVGIAKKNDCGAWKEVSFSSRRKEFVEYDLYVSELLQDFLTACESVGKRLWDGFGFVRWKFVAGGTCCFFHSFSYRQEMTQLMSFWGRIRREDEKWCVEFFHFKT